MKNYGKELKKIRKFLKLTQVDVSRISGLSEDTLTNLENGLVIPKYETIEILSHVYKFDLMKMLFYFKNENDILSLYEQLDDSITYNNFNKIKDIHSTLVSLKQNYPINRLIQFSDFDMLITYCQSNIIYYDKKSPATIAANAEKDLIDALTQNNPEFTLIGFNRFNYNFLEIRMLLLIALFESDTGNYNLSKSIMEFILGKLSTFDTYELIPIKFRLILYFNLSYIYHNLDNHKRAYKYAVEGIKLGEASNDYSNLFFLYYRKGIAELFLKKPNHAHTLKKSIYILEILEKYDLKKVYIESTLKNYNIDLTI